MAIARGASTRISSDSHFMDWGDGLGDGLTFREDSVTRAPRQGLRNKRPRGGELNLVVGKSRKVANIANIKPIAYHLSEYAVDQDLVCISLLFLNFVGGSIQMTVSSRCGILVNSLMMPPCFYISPQSLNL